MLEVYSMQKYRSFPCIHDILIYPMQYILRNVTLFMKSIICSVSFVELFYAHTTGFLMVISFAMMLNKRNSPMQNKQNAMFVSVM